MTRVKKPVPATLKGEAVRIRAKRELADLEQARFVAKALSQGASQESVADALGVSQSTVSRLAGRVKSQPPSLRPTVAEVVNRAAAQEISHARMLRELQDLRVAYAKPERPGSSFTPAGPTTCSLVACLSPQALESPSGSLSS